MSKYHLSLIIPAYNEEKILAGVLEKVIIYLKKKKYTWEIVVADDGSKDNTSKVAMNFREKGVNLVKLEVNQGKGAALRNGVMSSQGKYIIYTDADLSVPITCIDQMLEELEKGTPVVIGSRRVAGSDIQVHQPLIRESMGRVFTLLTKIVTGVNIPDFTCGFKGFSKEAGRKIFGKSVINRWSYDAEIIFLAKKLGYKIGQIPVSWKDRRESRVRLGSATVTSFVDLLRVRFNDLGGIYD